MIPHLERKVQERIEWCEEERETNVGVHRINQSKGRAKGMGVGPAIARSKENALH